LNLRSNTPVYNNLSDHSFSVEEKDWVVEQIDSGEINASCIADRYSISASTVRSWFDRKRKRNLQEDSGCPFAVNQNQFEILKENLKVAKKSLPVEKNGRRGQVPVQEVGQMMNNAAKASDNEENRDHPYVVLSEKTQNRLKKKITGLFVI
jgi:transposase-like protein